MNTRQKNTRSLRFSLRIACWTLAACLVLVTAFSVFYLINDGRNARQRETEETGRALDRTKSSLEDLIRRTENTYINLLFEDELYDLLLNFDRHTESLPKMSVQVRKILTKSLRNNDEIDSIQILSERYVFYTTNNTYTSTRNVGASPIYRRACGQSRAFWSPLFDFVEEYGHSNLMDRSLPIENRNLVSYAGRFNAFKSVKNVLRIWPSNMDKPVVQINITEETLRGFLTQTFGGRQGECFLADGDGRYISHTDPGRLFSGLDPEVMDRLRGQSGTDGMLKVDLDGADCLMQYTTLSNGWILAAIRPENGVYADTFRVIGSSLPGILLVAILLSVILAVLVSRRLSRPLRQLMQALDIAGSGVFTVNLPRSGDEFDEVKLAVNRMARRIDTLIHENYETRLSERENELRALKYQTKPHFLYNALAIIRGNAEKNGDARTAEMIQRLSNVMRYVLRGDQNMATVREEINNVVDYVELMRMGYEDQFRMEVEVEPGALNAAICKMTLQPLVENSVQHGLSARGKGGVIRITGHIEGMKLKLTVADNGAGWPEGFAINDTESAAESIGLANVRRRIMLTFGGQCEFRLFTPEGGGAGVELVFPYHFGAGRS